MNDDFNTPAALAVLFDLAGEANRTRDGAVSAQIKQLAATLGWRFALPLFVATGMSSSTMLRPSCRGGASTLPMS